MSAEIANQIADFGPNIGVAMLNQQFQVIVNVGIVNRLIKVFVDPG
jgi:hypothetical protein